MALMDMNWWKMLSSRIFSLNTGTVFRVIYLSAADDSEVSYYIYYIIIGMLGTDLGRGSNPKFPRLFHVCFVPITSEIVWAIWCKHVSGWNDTDEPMNTKLTTGSASSPNRSTPIRRQRSLSYWPDPGTVLDIERPVYGHYSSGSCSQRNAKYCLDITTVDNINIDIWQRDMINRSPIARWTSNRSRHFDGQ